MAFDTGLYGDTEFEPRTKDVPVPELAAFFGKDEKPVFTVKMLGSNDQHAAENAIPAGEAMQNLLALAGPMTPEKTELIGQLIGFAPSDDVEPTLKRQLEKVRLGLVSPALDRQILAKIAENQPDVFQRVYRAIMALTGEGAAALVKPVPSGSATTSETP